MDNDLERSVRLLEDALTAPSKGIFKISTPKHKRDKLIDLSISMAPDSIRYLMDADSTLYHDTMSIMLEQKSAAGSILQAGDPWKTATNNLYMEFTDILRTSSGGLEMLDVAADLARCCSDTLTVVHSLKSKVAIKELAEEKWLEAERNNWRLLYVLYQDRLQEQNKEPEDICYEGTSEKNCVGVLFRRENLIRESQLVIDWLERNALEKDNVILQYSDWTYGWEHTLHQLIAPDSIAIGSNTDIVKVMHPDAPHYEKRSLHHLDAFNEKKLCQRIFMEIRSGNLPHAQELCVNSGHTWRAALLEGWKLYHNSNEKDVISTLEYSDHQDIEGNSNRDLWKAQALEYCKDTHLDMYEKATLASLCGYLQGMLSVCSSWEDYLWAYMRTMVDIRVESEIRDTIIRNYRPLPVEYWEQKLSLDEIFKVLEASENATVCAEAREIDHIIQKHIILDEIPKLVELLDHWSQDKDASTQSLRFYAHLVLFFDAFGDTGNRKVAEKVIEAYVARLSEMNETEMIAFYLSKLSKRKQVVLYAKHCEKVLLNDDRKAALKYAEEVSLDIPAITKRIVESLCNQPTDLESFGNLPKRLSKADEIKISALDWLLFSEEQRVEALVQANSLIFKFLTLGKLEAAQLAINKIPHNTVELIQSEGEVSDEINQTIKNHLSYKAYLDAHEGFNEWFMQHKNKPNPPADLSENAQFTEKVAHKHRVSQYNAELERWKLTTSHSAKTARTLLYNVLLFPGGWLTGGEDADYLRSMCIPEIVLLLYAVLSESNLHEEAVQLSDLIAAERNALYKVYSKEKLGEILEKICESSVVLLNSKKDPWGNPNTA